MLFWFTKLSIQLLGAIILADTGVLDEEIRTKEAFSSYTDAKGWLEVWALFKYEFFPRYASEAEQTYQIFQQICYAGFMPDMLVTFIRQLIVKRSGKNQEATILHFILRVVSGKIYH